MKAPLWGTIPVVATALTAQNDTQDGVIRVSVDLVQVDAVVTDAKGNPVRGLKSGDFQILEDGNPAPAEKGLPFAPRVRRQDVGRTIIMMADVTIMVELSHSKPPRSSKPSSVSFPRQIPGQAP